MGQKPSGYFDLIQKAGSKGPYQTNLFILSFLLWLVTSFLVMGTSFLFLNPKFNCDSMDISASQCEDYVCSLPSQQRQKFYQKQTIISLATQFGPFHCERVLQLSALRMTFYIGTFFGYLGVFYFTDNNGRKFSMVLGWIITVIGISILSLSMNIWMAVAGLFLAGLGCESCIRISMTLIGQTVQNSLRQKYSIALEISFGIGSVLVGLGYLLISNWRIIIISFCLIPSIILLFLLIFYVQETPKFLIEKGPEIALKSLNRIAKINKRTQMLTLQDIESVSNNQVKVTKKRTPLDLCRFRSIRNNFIFTSIFLFCINFLYMGPAIIISELKLSMFTSQMILGGTQAISYPFCSFFIQKLPRKKSGYLLIGIPLIIFTALVFMEPQEDCSDCIQGIIEVILVFTARFGICAYFSVFFLYVTEIYPLPLRGIGFGMSSLFGAMANISSQFILSSISQTKINPMIIFGVISVVGLLAIYRLPQTLNKKLQQKILEQQGSISSRLYLPSGEQNQKV